MAFNVAIGALFTAINKRLCFEKEVNNTVLLEQCERLSFSKRIHLKTAFSSTITDRNENGAEKTKHHGCLCKKCETYS